MTYPLNINMWLGIAAELAALALLMGGLTIYQKWQLLAPETSRKLFHIGGGLTTLSFPWLFAGPWPVVLLALVTLPALLALKYMRAFKGNLNSVLYRVERSSFGELYFPLSVCLLFVFARGNALLFLIPVLILTLADPAAAFIGGHYGRLRYAVVRGRKSIEGSLAFFLVAFACVLVPLLLSNAAESGKDALIALLVGALATLAEAVAWEGLDNLFIPVFSGLLLAGLLQLNLPFLLLDLALALVLLSAILWFSRQHAREIVPQEGQ